MTDFEQLKNEIIKLSVPVFRKHSMTYESDWAYAVTKEEHDLMAPAVSGGGGETRRHAV